MGWAVGGAAQAPLVVAVCTRQLASGTPGGTTVEDAWTLYPLNMEEADPGGILTLAGGVIVLAAGTYLLSAAMAFVSTEGCAVRLRNTTAGTTLVRGINYYGATIGASPWLTGVFTVAAAQNLEIQYYAVNPYADYGLGVPLTTGDPEIYGRLVVTKIG